MPAQILAFGSRPLAPWRKRPHPGLLLSLTGICGIVAPGTADAASVTAGAVAEPVEVAVSAAVPLAKPALLAEPVLEAAPVLAGGITYERLPRQEVTLGVNAFYIDSFRRTGKTRMPLELTWHRFLGGPTVRSPYSYRVGLRSDFQSPLERIPLEAFVRGEWSNSLGYYQPSLGLELGLSAYTLFNPTPRGIPDSSYQSEAESTSPVYLSWCAAPIRFAYKRWSVSVLEIHLGTLLPNALQIARLEVGLLNFGMGY